MSMNRSRPSPAALLVLRRSSPRSSSTSPPGSRRSPIRPVSRSSTAWRAMESRASATSTLLGLSQPTISHHMKVLREAGLIEVAHQRKTWNFYRSPEAVEALAFALGGALSRSSCSLRPRAPLPAERSSSSASATRAGRRWRRRSTSGPAATRVGGKPRGDARSSRSRRGDARGRDRPRWARAPPALDRGRRVGGSRRDDGLRRRLPRPAREALPRLEPAGSGRDAGRGRAPDPRQDRGPRRRAVP